MPSLEDAAEIATASIDQLLAELRGVTAAADRLRRNGPTLELHSNNPRALAAVAGVDFRGHVEADFRGHVQIVPTARRAAPAPVPIAPRVALDRFPSADPRNWGLPGDWRGRMFFAAPAQMARASNEDPRLKFLVAALRGLTIVRVVSQPPPGRSRLTP